MVPKSAAATLSPQRMCPMRLIPLLAALVLAAPAGAGVTVVAHRGQSGQAVENTLPAISYAVQSGAAWIEADVRVTASGRSFVIAHDRTLNRTTNCAGRVARR